jgi:hypothetical protein
LWIAKNARPLQTLRDVALEFGRATAFRMDGANERKDDVPVRVHPQTLLIGRRLRDDGHDRWCLLHRRGASHRSRVHKIRNLNFDEIIRPYPIFEVAAFAQAALRQRFEPRLVVRCHQRERRSR